MPLLGYSLLPTRDQRRRSPTETYYFSVFRRLLYATPLSFLGAPLSGSDPSVDYAHRHTHLTHGSPRSKPTDGDLSRIGREETRTITNTTQHSQVLMMLHNHDTLLALECTETRTQLVRKGRSVDVVSWNVDHHAEVSARGPPP